MKIGFRQGIVRYQRDSSGLATYLLKNNGSIDLVAFNEPFIATFAYRKANYLHEESKTVQRAWTGFDSTIDYWLYIDLDMVSAQRTFGYTTIAPTYGPRAPANPQVDQHWFDIIATTMKVWNGINWSERTRIFVGQYESGSIIRPSVLGSQVDINTVNDAGFIIFDADGYPVRQHHQRKTFEYLTTASVFNTVTAKAINLSLDGICMTVKSTTPLPAFRLVTRDRQVGQEAAVTLADSTIPEHYAVGMIQEDFWAGDQGIITQQGYVYNEQWNFTDAPGTILFTGTAGVPVVYPPQTGFIQRIGEIVAPQWIRLDIQPAIRYTDSYLTDYKNVVPLAIDKYTGEPMMAVGYFDLPIKIINDLLKDASKLPVTALGGPKHLLEEWTANFLAEDAEQNRRIKHLEDIVSLPPVDLTVDYIRDIPMTTSVGGAIPGTTFNGTVQDALDKILYPFGVPKFTSFSLVGTNAVLEIGAKVIGGTRTFSWNTANPQNIKPYSLSITDISTNTILATQLPDISSASIGIGPDIVNNQPAQHTWAISGTDIQEGVLTRQHSIAWRWKVFYGSNELETVTGQDIQNLQNSTLPAGAAATYVLPATGYKWICYPASFPTLTSFKDAATGMNVAVNPPIVVQSTNQFGLATAYKCHRTYNKLGSSITVIGS